MAFIDPSEGEAQSAAEVASARQAFLSEPPEIYNNLDDEPVIDEAAQAAADEAAALDELSSSAPEGATPPPPAPAPTPPADPYAAFGGEEAVRTAHQVQEALRTEQGVRALVANGLQALGYSTEAIRAALAGEAAAEPAAAPAQGDPLAGLDDEDVVDVKTIRQLVQTVATQAAEAAAAQALAATQPQVQSVQEAVLAQQQAQVRNYTDTALIEVLGQPPTDAEQLKEFKANVDATVNRAGAYYNPALAGDPNHIRACIQQANADIGAENEARLKAYVASKKRARDAQPVNVGGGAGAEGEMPEPRNMKEAREQARKGGFFQ